MHPLRNVTKAVKRLVGHFLELMEPNIFIFFGNECYWREIYNKSIILYNICICLTLFRLKRKVG